MADIFSFGALQSTHAFFISRHLELSSQPAKGPRGCRSRAAWLGFNSQKLVLGEKLALRIYNEA